MDASIILVIIAVSGLLGFWQERGAADAIQQLLAKVEIKAMVFRDGKVGEIAVHQVVPGDVIQVSAGDNIPGDCLLIESQTLFLDEATLTGETFPASKNAGILPSDTSLSQRSNFLFMGTHVVSGSARALVCSTGTATEFGKISDKLKFRPPETEFELGIRKFGYLLLEITLLLGMSIFACNVYLHRPVLDSFLFALALAVGLTPQLLPAIISINLAHGAKQMANMFVIVKRLPAIENFGCMNVLCSDKTGTLTDGQVHIQMALSINGSESEKVLFYAYLNASAETGYVNPIDEAIRNHKIFDIDAYKKRGEIPYDFVRKRLSILFEKDNQNILISKGALTNILDVCISVENENGTIENFNSIRENIQNKAEELGNSGFRILGIAYRTLSTNTLTHNDEENLTFLGFLALYDPPKKGIKETIATLANMGVAFKIITGDNHAVAQSVAKQIGFPQHKLLTGSDIRKLSDAALMNQVNKVSVFAEVEPNQKERIILALKKAGNVVGYIGDGINDASALYAADVGISVDTAVDVAKEAADIVLMKKDLSVLQDGIIAGRKTFANTLKYVFMAASANFGNMFSMAGISIFIPFLPLLPKQILLTNLLTDLPEITIATDLVDTEQVHKPHRWNIGFIRNFMIAFGLLSSLFDFITFAILLKFLNATQAQFRTGWFIESVISAACIVLVIRTRHPFFRSKTSKYLLSATALCAVITLTLPYSPLATTLGFEPLPIHFVLSLLFIVLAYIVAAELIKRVVYKRLWK